MSDIRGASRSLTNNMEIIPTVVPQSFDDITAAKARYGAYATSIHIDAADGVFAPNATWLPVSGEKLPDAANITYEAHLMIENPLSIGVSFARAGAKRIIGHVEAFQNAECAREAFDMWLKAGAREVGVAILLDTPLQELMPYSGLTDSVLVMTIAKIGKQGAPFDERGTLRVREIRKRYPDFVIAADGGISEKNIAVLASAGATRFCSGSSLAKAKDPAKAYSQLLNAASSV